MYILFESYAYYTPSGNNKYVFLSRPVFHKFFCQAFDKRIIEVSTL